MHFLVVLSHPLPTSLTAAAARTVAKAAEQAGHEVRLLDLSALQFDPVMPAAEWLNYANPFQMDAVQGPEATHLQDLLWAEALVLVYPIWWSGMPAQMKGWLDRVLRPGVAFHLKDGRMLPGLPRIKVLGVVTTLGASWFQWNILLGAPGRRAVLRGLRACTGPGCRTFWLALHRIDATTLPKRQAFLARVAARIARL